MKCMNITKYYYIWILYVVVKRKKMNEMSYFKQKKNECDEFFLVVTDVNVMNFCC